MSDRLFVDTNLLIYLHDLGEPQKRSTARRWLARLLDGDRLVVSLQILNEFYQVATRRFPSTPRSALRRFVDDLRVACTAPFDLATIDRAREVQDATGYNWYDCLVVASAFQAGCKYLITEDMQHGRRLGDLIIADPFRTDPDALIAN